MIIRITEEPTRDSRSPLVRKRACWSRRGRQPIARRPPLPRHLSADRRRGPAGEDRAAFPHIRLAQGVEPLCRKEDQLIALVTDGDWDLGVPRFALLASPAFAVDVD